MLLVTGLMKRISLDVSGLKLLGKIEIRLLIINSELSRHNSYNEYISSMRSSRNALAKWKPMSFLATDENTFELSCLRTPDASFKLHSKYRFKIQMSREQPKEDRIMACSVGTLLLKYRDHRNFQSVSDPKRIDVQ